MPKNKTKTKSAGKEKRTRKLPAKKDRTAKNIAYTFNKLKEYEGKRYTGMTVGRKHKWKYEEGTWIDKKVSPERWVINFSVKKRRKGNAPEGSGAPVGTEYHWYILAHQVVKKLDANTYSTEMNGLKFKLAHKRFDSEKWNISDKAQRNQLIRILQDYIQELEEEPIEAFIAQEQDVMKPANGEKKKDKKKAKKEERKLELEEA